MRSAILFLVFLASFGAYANTIVFPENMSVENVNGIEQSGHFFARETQLNLSSGNHVIVVKYQDLFEGDDDHTTVTSKPFVLLFTLNELLLSSEKINVTLPVLDELHQAKAFAKRPKVKLLTQSGDEITSVSQSLINFNAQGKFAQLINNTKSMVLNDKAIANSRINGNDSLRKASCNNKEARMVAVSDFERLKCLWQKTNKVEQEAFIHYVLTQQQAAIQKTVVQTLKANK